VGEDDNAAIIARLACSMGIGHPEQKWDRGQIDRYNLLKRDYRDVKANEAAAAAAAAAADDDECIEDLHIDHSDWGKP
jgi:hypothetical protein